MHLLEKNIFKNLWLLVIDENSNQTIDIIVKLYYKHI